MARLIGLLILIIDVVIVLEIIKSKKDTEKKILWVIAVVFLPVLGPILYLIMGRK
ncbi:MAG: PLDc_N domain-containing protein [Cyclobacteriaceae bacterium]|nr:PLDc_N domain-containing protein [Cyclobacteriaceae bacterium]